MARILALSSALAALTGCTALIDLGPLQSGDGGQVSGDGGRSDASAEDGSVAHDGGMDGGMDAGADAGADAGGLDAGADAARDDAAAEDGGADGGAADAGADASCATDTEESCGTCGTMCAAGSACLPEGAGHRCVPRDCGAVRTALGASGAPLDDGDYLIDPDGHGPVPALAVYCADVATDTPLEYLNVDPTHNFSTSKDHDDCSCHSSRRIWTRLRLWIDRTSGVAFYVSSRDIRFTTLTGFQDDGTEDPSCATELPPPCWNGWDPVRHPVPNAWGGINSCGYQAPPAEGQYDLSGTGFRFPASIASTVRIIGAAFMPRDQLAMLDATATRLTLRFSAGCGSWGLAVLDTTAPLVLTPIELVP